MQHSHNNLQDLGLVLYHTHILQNSFSKNKINYVNLPKSGFNSVGKLSFLDIFAEK